MRMHSSRWRPTDGKLSALKSFRSRQRLSAQRARDFTLFCGIQSSDLMFRPPEELDAQVPDNAEQPRVLPHGSLRFDEAERTKKPGFFRRGVLVDALSVGNKHARGSSGRAKGGVSSSSDRWETSREVRKIQRRTRAGPGNMSRFSSFNACGLTAQNICLQYNPSKRISSSSPISSRSRKFAGLQ